MEPLQGSESSAIVLHKWETVLVFKSSSVHRDSETARAGIRRQRGGRGRAGLCPLPPGSWVVVLVYCLSGLIFIKLWGQTQSDAAALLWRGGVWRQHPGPPALRDPTLSLSLALSVMKSRRATNRLSLRLDGECHHRRPRAQRLMETTSAVTTSG